jgi:proline iminopeptidase
VGVGNAQMFCRYVGEGPPLLILHGGPEFDHTYLVPGMDALSDSCRLIYYDQRGRGRSSGKANDVSMASEIDDIDSVRKHFGLDTVAIIGHSFGGLLAMNYAIAHPDRVSHLILMNSVPASSNEMERARARRRGMMEPYRAEMERIASTDEFRKGDLATVSKFYKKHCEAMIKKAEQLDRVDLSLKHFTPDGVIRARGIENKLAGETFSDPNYDLVDRLKNFTGPTLIIHSDYDFISDQFMDRIARAMPNVQLVVLKDCGHFAFIEKPEEVKSLITGFVK